MLKASVCLRFFLLAAFRELRYDRLRPLPLGSHSCLVTWNQQTKGRVTPSCEPQPSLLSLLKPWLLLYWVGCTTSACLLRLLWHSGKKEKCSLQTGQARTHSRQLGGREAGFASRLQAQGHWDGGHWVVARLSLSHRWHLGKPAPDQLMVGVGCEVTKQSSKF